MKVYKKAQLLAFIIGTEFAGRSNLPFPLPATNRIPACVDNVLPSEWHVPVSLPVQRHSVRSG